MAILARRDRNIKEMTFAILPWLDNILVFSDIFLFRQTCQHILKIKNREQTLSLGDVSEHGFAWASTILPMGGASFLFWETGMLCDTTEWGPLPGG